MVKWGLVYMTRRNRKCRFGCSGESICFALRLLLNCPNDGKDGGKVEWGRNRSYERCGSLSDDTPADERYKDDAEERSVVPDALAEGGEVHVDEDAQADGCEHDLAQREGEGEGRGEVRRL
jgi:hypothetical protein